MMKRGGKPAKKPVKKLAKKVVKRMPAKPTQSVNVKVHVGDTVQLMKGRAPQQQVGDFRLLKGVGATYASEPLVLKQSSYGIYPASVAPMYNSVVKVGGGSEYNANKKDDLMIPTNPEGIAPKMTPSKRMIPGKDMFANRRVNYSFVQETPFKGENPAGHQVPVFQQSARAVPNVQKAVPSLRSILMPGSSDIFQVRPSASAEEMFDEKDDEPIGRRVSGAGPGRRPEKEMLTYGPSGVQQTIPLSARKMVRGGVF
jgi:hypothetical protein